MPLPYLLHGQEPCPTQVQGLDLTRGCEGIKKRQTRKKLASVRLHCLVENIAMH